MTALWAIVTFPGSNAQADCRHALGDILGYRTILVRHTDTVPDDVDCIVLPGGFSHGDYLRPGALAAMSPVVESIRGHVEKGTLILGICNGFQILLETGLLPGAMLQNAGGRFQCKDVYLQVANADHPFANSTLGPGEVIRLPVAHGFGNYYTPPIALHGLVSRAQIAFRYCDALGEIAEGANPNGSVLGIAGITNAAGNVLGMMPHPERACDPMIGGLDGRKIFRAMALAAAELRAGRSRPNGAGG